MTVQFINFRPVKPPACPNLRRNRWAVAGVVVFNVVVWGAAVWALTGLFG